MLNKLVSKKSFCLIILFSSLNIFTHIYSSYLLKNNIKNLKNDSSFGNLASIISKLLACFTILYITNNRLEYYIAKQIKNIFNLLTNRIINYDIKFFKKYTINNINQMLSNLNSQESLIEKVTIDLPKFLVYSLYYFYMIYQLSGYILMMIVIIIFITLTVIHPYQNRKLCHQEQKIINDLETKNIFIEAISNIDMIKMNNKQEFEINKINNIYDKYFLSKLSSKYLDSWIDYVNNVSINNVAIMIIFIGIKFSNDEIIFLALSTKSFFTNLSEIKDIYFSYKKNYHKLQYIFNIINYPNIEDLLISSNEPNIEDKNNIIFDKISFKYFESGKFVFNNFNIKFLGNKINILTGQNGFGKSTLIRLLLKMYCIEKGNIYLFGQNINNFSIYQIRSMITYVIQDPSIFNNTILYNVQYGNDLQLKDINLQSNLLGITDWLELNKNKTTGYNGRECSGGENKRIQLLNGLCKKSDIIIFDEPTNHLDDETIKKFINILNEFKIQKNKTVIIITHDLRLFKLADNLINI